MRSSLECAVHESSRMTTIGQLVTELFTTYERQLHDPRLAAIETKLVVEELLRRRERITPARVIEKAA